MRKMFFAIMMMVVSLSAMAQDAKVLAKAEKGDVNAMQKLGDAYFKGKGVEKDEAKAKEWYQKAKPGKEAQAKDGDVKAMTQLATGYEKGVYGDAPDQAKAFEYWKMAAEKNDLKSMVKVGNYMMKGAGTAQDMKGAVKWYEKAAEAGSADAMKSLGDCYASSKKGVEKDVEKAKDYYAKAIAAGSKKAQAALDKLNAKVK